MSEIVFEVPGSKGAEYVVRFSMHEGKPICECSCPAGVHRRACKHRIGIIEEARQGKGEDERWAKVAEMLEGSEVLAVLDEVAVLEWEKSRVDAALKPLKRKLGRILG